MATSVKVKRGDTARKIQDTLTIDGSPINLTGTVVKLVFRRNLSSATVVRTATILSPAAGTVEYQLVAEDTAVAGTFYLEWHISGLGAGLLRVPTDGYHALEVLEDLPES